MKFVKVAVKKDMIRIKEDDGRETWYNTTKAVKEYAKKTFKAEDDIEITATEAKNGGLGFVSRVTKPGSYNPPASKFNCEICGKPLKNDKYKTCYECSQKKSTSQPTDTTEKNELIKREAVAHATSRAINALTGQVDPNNIHEIIKSLYKTFLDLVEGR